MLKILENGKLSFVLPLLLAVFCLFINFDLTDESYYLYHLIHPSELAMNFYHVLLHPVGELFGHLALGYRIINFCLLLGSSLYFAQRTQKYLKLSGYTLLISSLSFIYFCLLVALSYNSLLFVVFFLLVGSLLGPQNKTLTYLVYPALVIIGFSCRSNQVFILCSYILILGYLIHKKILWKEALLGFLLCLVIVLCHLEHTQEVIAVLKGHALSVHYGILPSYLKAIAELFYKYFLVWGLLFLILNKFRPGWKEYFYPVVILGYALATLDPAKAYKLLLAICLIRLLELRKTLSPELFLILFIGSFTPIIIPIGTNNNLIEASHFYIAFSAPFMIFIFKDLKWFRPIPIIHLGYILVATMLIKGPFLKPYRNPSIFQTKYVPSENHLLRGLWIPQEIEESIKTISSVSAALPPGPLLAMETLPSLPLFLNRDAYGTAWYFSGYRDLDQLGCTYIRFEKSKEMPTLALNRMISTEISKCLKEKNVPLDNYESLHDITIWSHKKPGTQTIKFFKAKA